MMPTAARAEFPRERNHWANDYVSGSFDKCIGHGTRDNPTRDIGESASFTVAKCWDVPCPMSYALVKRPADVMIPQARCCPCILKIAPKQARRQPDVVRAADVRAEVTFRSESTPRHRRG
jgi:hypothetical protein